MLQLQDIKENWYIGKIIYIKRFFKKSTKCAYTYLIFSFELKKGWWLEITNGSFRLFMITYLRLGFDALLRQYKRRRTFDPRRMSYLMVVIFSIGIEHHFKDNILFYIKALRQLTIMLW